MSIARNSQDKLNIVCIETGGQSVLMAHLTILILQPHKLFAMSLATQDKELNLQKFIILFQMELYGWEMLDVWEARKI